MSLTFGTRKSKWARAATEGLLDQARAKHTTEFKIVELDSPGDLNQIDDVTLLGGLTSFVDALSVEVAAGHIDGAVHTVKDISWPSEFEHFPEGSYSQLGLQTTQGLVIAAVSKRSNPCDACVFREGENFATFTRNNKPIRVGTNSRLRTAALHKLYPDITFQIMPIRGNIDVRLTKLDNNEYDALLLSMDGLLAVNQQQRANIIFDINDMPPAFGQAIGAAEVRVDNHNAVTVLSEINDKNTMTCLRAEWATMKFLQATSATPVGGLCTMNDDGSLSMFATMMAVDGKTIRAKVDNYPANDPEALGVAIAQQLLEQGAETIESSWQNDNRGQSQDTC